MDESTRKDIERISYNILKESKSLNVFPTPVDQILAYSNFALDNSIQLNKVDTSFFGALQEKLINPSIKALNKALSKIKGIFDREEKVIYIDTSLNTNLGKKNFVKLHEIGHGVLSWQNDVMLALDNGESLSEECQEQFEAEANYFASITLFQQEIFWEESQKLNLGLGAVMELSKKFGSSVHSAFRNYVLQSKHRCALLVLNHPVGEIGIAGALTSRNLFYSRPFLKEIGELSLPTDFDSNWSFAKDFKYNKKFHENGSMTLESTDGEMVDTNYHYFNNSYNSFVFIFPKGEKNKAKTRIILQ